MTILAGQAVWSPTKLILTHLLYGKRTRLVLYSEPRFGHIVWKEDKHSLISIYIPWTNSKVNQKGKLNNAEEIQKYGSFNGFEG